ncbi:WASH complex subunit 2-like [Sycon ciliatum]|uniref:WASH complex subunit 2-like n=1 Tax=Sycon ciliatum TaxID=27933 RepID=UPI0031F6AC9C
MSASALREEAERRWGALPADDKENLTAEAKAAAKAKAGAVFGRKAPRTSTANGDPGPAAAAAVLSSSPSPLVTDSLEDNIVEYSLDATPLLDSVNAANANGDNVSAVTSIGLLDDGTCLSPPVKRSRGARFIDSDDDEVDDAVENGGSAAAAATEQAAPAAKRAKLPEASTANIVAQSTKASAQKLANFAFAK